MKIPKWKKYWSYLNPILLEETSSQYNQVLEIWLTKGRNQLSTEDAIYSFDDKYNNFNYTFNKINWTSLQGHDVLVLGLGLGSVILMLENLFDLTLNYTAIEIDPEIIRLCNKYTLQNLNSSVEIISTDAESFINIDTRSYDFIIMDIFQSAKIPFRFQNEDFLSKLKTKLKSNGLLLYNTMNITDEDKLEFEELFRSFQKVFKEAIPIDINQNIVLLNDKNYLQDN